MPTVFLSYRRSDSGGLAGRLGDALRAQLGQNFAFRDVTHITPGEHFDSAIDSRLTDAKVVLVLIGRTWLAELTRRLTLDDIDYHRREVAVALQAGKRVVPVLLDGAALPATDALPEDLRGLTRCHALSMRDETWDADVERLITSIGRPVAWGRVALRAVAAVLVIVLGVFVLARLALPDAEVATLRSLILGLIGGYALIEAALALRQTRRLG
jgi:hypothetical protein